MKDKEKCFVCNKDITNELPKIDIEGNHYCKDCYSDKCKKELKEKQIEEISKILDLYSGSHSYNKAYNIANALYLMGYRKLPEDSVVLSREEYEALKKIEKAYDPFWSCSFGGCEGVCKECKDTCEMSIFVKERKETAEKCNSILEKNYKDWLKVLNDLKIDTSNKNILVSIVCGLFKNSQEDIAKQFGVEIKEN